LKYFLAILLLFILIAGAAAAWMWYGITKPYQDFAKEGVFVDVPHGASSRHVASLLKTNGVVRSALAFEIYARRHPKRTLQAGEYFFDHAMTGREVSGSSPTPGLRAALHGARGETMFDIARELEAAEVHARG